MKIRIVYILTVAIVLTSLSGCGIFHKDCGCPHFGMIKTPANPVKVAVIV